mgnify:CR=1 FL=1
MIHQLIVIAHGQDPNNIFDPEIVVHHRNTHKYDNRPENLEVMSISEHSRHHYDGISENEVISEDECRKVIEKYQENTISEIADAYSVSVSCAWDHLSGECSHHNEDHTKGHKGPRNGPWRDGKLFRIEYVEKGKTTTELADEWDCSLGTVSRWKNRHGL